MNVYLHHQPESGPTKISNVLHNHRKWPPQEEGKRWRPIFTHGKIIFIFPLNCYKFKSIGMSMSICILQCQHSEACGQKKCRAQDNEMRKQVHSYFTSKIHCHFFMCLIKLCLCHSHLAVTSQLSFVNEKPMGSQDGYGRDCASDSKEPAYEGDSEDSTRRIPINLISVWGCLKLINALKKVATRNWSVYIVRGTGSGRVRWLSSCGWCRHC